MPFQCPDAHCYVLIYPNLLALNAFISLHLFASWNRISSTYFVEAHIPEAQAASCGMRLQKRGVHCQQHSTLLVVPNSTMSWGAGRLVGAGSLGAGHVADAWASLAGFKISLCGDHLSPSIRYALCVCVMHASCCHALPAMECPLHLVIDDFSKLAVMLLDW